MQEIDRHGVELDEERAAYVREHLSVDDLRRRNAMTFGWEGGTFGLVSLSTMFMSILDKGGRRRIVSESIPRWARAASRCW
jgi:hypothetical protein